ncbi:MAG: PKD domain-containing protein, partial [Candidatus Peregrinibacteria bacterium]|nr:PKD domain-containing protein [Candidatus Peregrinibacteria bacterium]
FTNLSTVSSGLASKILDYTWNFGDPDVDSYEAQKDKITAENPSYQYPAPGTYVVTLTVVDADQVTDASTQEVVIVGGAETETPDVSEDVEDEPKVEKSGSIIGKIFKIMLYLILIVIVLVLMIVGGLLAFLKIQHPDLVFEELIDELKIKLLSVMGVHELEHEGAVPEAPAPEATSEESAAAEAPEEAPEQGPGEASQEGAEEQVDLSTSDGPMPDWMKPQQEMPAEEPAASDVIEGEVEEEVAEEPTAQPEVPAAPVEEVSDDKPPKEGGEKPEAGEAAAGDISKDDGPVPDWLKQG